jgi:hypothetical protein
MQIHRTFLILFSLGLAACDHGAPLPGETSSQALQQRGPLIACVVNAMCPEGQTCEDYDCNGEWHCAPPDQGGNGNCCWSNYSCQAGWECIAGMCVPDSNGDGIMDAWASQVDFAIVDPPRTP